MIIYISFTNMSIYSFLLNIKSHISSLMFFAVNCPPKTILFKVWKRQFPSIPLGIILNWEVRDVALFKILSDSMENSEDSSVISSVKISLSHHFYSCKSVRVDFLFCLIRISASSDLDLSILFLTSNLCIFECFCNSLS